MGHQLSVDLNDLLEGLKHFKVRRKIRSWEKAILGFDGRFLSIEALDVVIVAKASGAWPGVARISPSVLIALAKLPHRTIPSCCKLLTTV